MVVRKRIAALGALVMALAALGGPVRAQAEPDDTHIAQWALEEINAPAAWAQAHATLGDKAPAPVVVAVIDTGVDTAHPALKDRVLPGHNVLTGAIDPSDSADQSHNGHGTAVAGLVAGVTPEVRHALSAAAMAPVRVLPVKALGPDASAGPDDVARAIRWALQWRGAEGERVRIINLSLGERMPTAPAALAEAVQAAGRDGVLVVAAAGNLSDKVSAFFPAALPEVLSVGASRPDHTLQPSSNTGALVVAPGVELSSTLPGGTFGRVTGTAFAAPVISASAAVLWSVYPQASRAQLITALIHGQVSYPCGDGDSQTCPVFDLDVALTRLAEALAAQR